MAGFRTIAVHDDQKLQLPTADAIITLHLNEFEQYTRHILAADCAFYTDFFLKINKLNNAARCRFDTLGSLAAISN